MKGNGCAGFTEKSSYAVWKSVGRAALLGQLLLRGLISCIKQFSGLGQSWHFHLV